MNVGAPLGGKTSFAAGGIMVLALLLAACKGRESGPPESHWSPSVNAELSAEMVVTQCGRFFTAALLLSSPQFIHDPSLLAGVHPAQMNAQLSINELHKLQRRWADHLNTLATDNTRRQKEAILARCEAGHSLSELEQNASLEEVLITMLSEQYEDEDLSDWSDAFNRPTARNAEALVASLSSAELHHLALLLIDRPVE